MVLFCPTCGNVLLVERGPGGRMRSYCQTCPYVYNIDQKISKTMPLKKVKEIDPIFGDEIWQNAPKTKVKCPACEFGEAYFYELQTRSADEPSTIFFRCAKCRNKCKVG